jgi:hemerythrin-like domain-containing protein
VFLKSKILQSLHEDHANLIQLLSLIETEVDKHGKLGETADFELISLALEYCTDYPARYHHPKEDLVYEKLIQRDPDIANQAVILTEEHEKLQDLTQEFSTVVGESIGGTNTEKLQKNAVCFLKFYRYHIGIEESEVFPCARRALTEDDWISIDNAYSRVTDPLFGEHTRQSYLALQQRIIERAVCHNSRLPA